MDKLCKICEIPSSMQCSKCKVVYYCSRDHQVQDWKQHKTICNQKDQKDKSQQQTGQIRQELIDDNLKQDESVGTFRWNESMKLLNAPEYLELLQYMEGGWKDVLGERFEQIADKSLRVKVEPHQVDCLSFAMTIVFILFNYQLIKSKSQINLIIMGGSAKAEERIFVQTNYFEELTNYMPNIKFDLYFVGPELSSKNHNQMVKKNENLVGYFYKGKVKEFLQSNQLPQLNTYLIGFNPGFGSGFDKLLFSWCQDLVYLLDKSYYIFFTQANDYSDLKGELLVYTKIFQNQITFSIKPRDNPFKAMTTYCQEGNKEKCWSSSATHFYGIKGWKQPISLENINKNLDSQETKDLLDILKSYSMGNY